MKYVYDFATSQANGTIASVCLTHKNGGFTSYGSKNCLLYTSMAFGDYSYYWIADRQGRSFKRLNELYATTGQVGFLASERVDEMCIRDSL